MYNICVWVPTEDLRSHCAFLSALSTRDIIPCFSFALKFLAQNKGSMSEAFLAVSWLGPKSDAGERNLTNRSALASQAEKI